MGCPGVVVEVEVSAAPTSVVLFEGQLGVGGLSVGLLALLPPPSHSQVRVVVSELRSWPRVCGLPGLLD